MRVRLVPVGEIFRRMPFVVRDLARESGKRVHLDLRGQGTEIDKFIIERMMDPVLHLVRNAVGHGIETPDERIAQGKPPDATVTLAAAAVGELVRIDIADDGRGIDVPRVLERARAMGLPLPTGTPDSAGLLSLMCAPGFSTSEQTDRISGRGVGMNVVKAAVEALSGSLSLETTPGAGSRFTIQLPLTLAIADALIARVGDETFAVPQVAVREVIEVNADDVRVLENQEIVPYRGTALPLLRLSRVFSMAHRGGGRFHVFVIAAPNATGIVVDRIVGQREIVVRRIADPLVKSEGISGATDLGDGRVVLILDPTALTRLVRPGAADRAREKYA
jgi:two-component system chemotaxis sensor kinase CheA